MIKIIIDCEENDIVDIKCGGPRILGYDFYVEDENVDDMIIFIKEMLKKYNQPLMDIKTILDVTCTYVWNKENIEKCIKEGY